MRPQSVIRLRSGIHAFSWISDTTRAIEERPGSAVFLAAASAPIPRAPRRRRSPSRVGGRPDRSRGRRGGLPESLADSRTAELLEGVCDVDLDALNVELPQGFSRD